MKFRFCVLLAVLLVARWVCAAEHTKDSLDKVKENLANKKAILIDVRELKEWDVDHLQDAQLVPLSELKRLSAGEAEIRQKLEKSLPKDRIIYSHCRSGARVLVAAEILEKLGYDIRPLADGFSNLRAAGFPAAKK